MSSRAPRLAAPGLAALAAHLLQSLTRPIYALYGRRLLAQVMQRPPPRHVGIILDGNRRFGRLSGVVDPLQVYAQGAQKLDDLLDWCGELSIPAVTLWVCSTDNLARQPQEVAGILGALEVKLRALVSDPQIHRRRVRVQAIGRLDLLPDSTLAAIRAAEAATADYDAMRAVDRRRLWRPRGDRRRRARDADRGNAGGARRCPRSSRRCVPSGSAGISILPARRSRT